MKLMVSGHRRHKLINYDEDWIKTAIESTIIDLKAQGLALGFSGMASGVDLWFCGACFKQQIPYIGCVPFEEQGDDYPPDDYNARQVALTLAKEIKKVRNSFMVDTCDAAIVVWDGNKGGTHNCFQQLLEAKKDIWWINPIKEKVILV